MPIGTATCVIRVLYVAIMDRLDLCGRGLASLAAAAASLARTEKHDLHSYDGRVKAREKYW